MDIMKRTATLGAIVGCSLALAAILVSATLVLCDRALAQPKLKSQVEHFLNPDDLCKITRYH